MVFMPPYRGFFRMVNVKIQITTQQMIQVVGSQKQTARYPIDGTRNRAKSINAHQRDDVLGGKPSDGAAHFKRNRRKRSPLHGNVSGFSKRICTGRRWNICSGDGFSQRQTICGTQTNFALVVFGNRWYNHFINARHL